MSYMSLFVLCVFFFFFFKQKTAYEIGTGDWSSDVCSDLVVLVVKRVDLEEVTLFIFNS